MDPLMNIARYVLKANEELLRDAKDFSDKGLFSFF